MTIKLTVSHRQRLLKMLHMQYTPAEIAQLLQMDLEKIVLTGPESCPHQIDENGQAWINGSDFRGWAERRANNLKSMTRNIEPINRQNWIDVNAYLDYSENVSLTSPKTVICRRTQLRRLLEWAAQTPFSDVKEIRPAFPSFLTQYRADGKQGQLASETTRATCEIAQKFLTWCKGEYPTRYEKLSDAWIQTLKFHRRQGARSELKQHQFYTPGEIIALTHVPGDNLSLMRDRAAAAFLFLSGMRIDAFLTLPIECVNLETMAISQLPSKGVRTKNSKAAITYLLNIQELLTIVREWDSLVRENLPGNALWYSILEHKNGGFVNRSDSNPNRVGNFRRDLRRLCHTANVAYKSPHKIRHGHAIYAIQNAKTIEELKAASQNLMHESMVTTDKIYGNLDGKNVKEVISRLGHAQPDEQISVGQFLTMLKAFVSEPELLQQVMMK